MNRKIAEGLASLLLLSEVFAGTAFAGETVKPVGVVELFTSQGCSSCPPADAVLGDLVDRGDVVALAYHVDYWDYLGWRDTLGSAENTQRQYAYGRMFGSRSVYTPQAVLNGRMDVNGANGAAVADGLEKLAKAGEGLTVDLDVTRVGDSFVIEAGPATGEMQNAHLVLVYFDERSPVVIEKGENSGNTIVYWNAVKRVQAAGMWHGTQARFELPASEISKKDGCAVLLQAVDSDGLPGPILAATVISNTDTAAGK